MNYLKAIKTQMDKKGWSQQDLADKAGLHKSAVSLLMNSKASVNLVQLEKIARALNVPMSRIIREAEKGE